MSYFNDDKRLNSLAYLAYIFEKLDCLNLKLQGKDTNIIQLNDNVKAFVSKLKNWLRKVHIGNIAMFDRLSSVSCIEETGEEFEDLKKINCGSPAVHGVRVPTLLSRTRRARSYMSAAWRSGSERRFYNDHDRKVNGSTPNLVSLLRPWIRCFTMIISAWWNLASSKLKKSEENSSGKLGNKGNS